jgi:mannose-6-phosphate isomerase-like protein (cupin superfamily)
MLLRRLCFATVLASCLSLAAAGGMAVAGEVSSSPRLKVVPLEPGDQAYLLLLHGPPETKSMRSGLVTLAPGKSIGVHNTLQNEEVLIPLAGSGELRIAGEQPVSLRPGLITYAPPHTQHDVVNTGSTPLRYIFIVAKAE